MLNARIMLTAIIAGGLCTAAMAQTPFYQASPQETAGPVGTIHS